MDKKKKEVLSKMRELRSSRESEIEKDELNITVRDVKYLGKIRWIDEIDGNRVEKEKDIYMIVEERSGSMTYKYYDENMEMLAAQRATDEILMPSEKYLNREDKSFIADIEELDKEGETLEELEQEEKTEGIKTSNKDEKVPSKPAYVIQTVNLDQAYVDKLHTLRTELNLPSEVKELAFAYPSSEQDRKLSDDLTVFMLDKDGNKIEQTKDGRTITDILEVDDATGNNPMYDDNTKLELDEYAEKNKSLTLKRFRSKENPEMYLSVEQKELGDYAELYAGGKTHDGNDPVECQLETDNVSVQTSLEMQEIIDGRNGIHTNDEIDKEADSHEAHGDDTNEISKENADGNVQTIEICGENVIPGTDKTWQQFANICGYRGADGIEKAQKEFLEYKKDHPDMENKEIIEDIEEELENEMPGLNRNKR